MPGLFDPTLDPDLVAGEGLPLDLPTPAPKASKWKELAPLLSILPLAFKQGGRMGGAALLQGFQQARQQREQQSQLQSQQQQALQQRNALLNSQIAARNETATNNELQRRQQFIDKFTAGLDTIDTPEAAQAYLALQAMQGDALGVPRADLEAMVPTASTLSKKRAQKELERLQKARPDDWQNWSVTVDGQQVKATDLAGIVRNPDAAPVAPKDKRGFQTKEITLDGGRTHFQASFDPDTNQYYGIGSDRPLTPRTGFQIQEWQRPPQSSSADPELANIRRETAAANLALLRQRVADATGKATGVKLSPAQQNDLADAKTLSDMASAVLDVGVQTDWDGTGGMGYGSVANWAAKNFGLGSSEAASLRANVSNIQATIAKLRGGTSFTPNEQRLLEQYTPTINESPKSIMAKLKGLQAFLAQKAENMVAAASRGAGDLVNEMRRNADAPLPTGRAAGAGPGPNPFRAQR